MFARIQAVPLPLLLSACAIIHNCPCSLNDRKINPPPYSHNCFSLSPSLIAIGPVRRCRLLFWILQRKHLTVWLSLLTSDSLSRELAIRLQKSGISEPVAVFRLSLATSPTSTLSSTYHLQLGTQVWFFWFTKLAGSGQGYFEALDKSEMTQLK